MEGLSPVTQELSGNGRGPFLPEHPLTGCHWFSALTLSSFQQNGLSAPNAFPNPNAAHRNFSFVVVLLHICLGERLSSELGIQQSVGPSSKMPPSCSVKKKYVYFRPPFFPQLGCKSILKRAFPPPPHTFNRRHVSPGGWIPAVPHTAVSIVPFPSQMSVKRLG